MTFFDLGMQFLALPRLIKKDRIASRLLRVPSSWGSFSVLSFSQYEFSNFSPTALQHGLEFRYGLSNQAGDFQFSFDFLKITVVLKCGQGNLRPKSG